VTFKPTTLRKLPTLPVTSSGPLWSCFEGPSLRRLTLEELLLAMFILIFYFMMLFMLLLFMVNC
jgi:hypothetical protein